MKIELRNGTMIHVDSAEELAAALKVIGTEKMPEKKSVIDAVAQLADEGERVKAFFRSINPNARKFMVALIAYKNGVKGERFAESSGFSSEKFGGIMGGIEKHATNQELKRESFIISEQRIEGTSRYRFLAPGKMLLKYEIDLNKTIIQERESEAISVGA
jgi:hypothetical protein